MRVCENGGHAEEGCGVGWGEFDADGGLGARGGFGSRRGWGAIGLVARVVGLGTLIVRVVVRVRVTVGALVASGWVIEQGFREEGSGAI